jgi:hypothetical protein
MHDIGKKEPDKHSVVTTAAVVVVKKDEEEDERQKGVKTWLTYGNAFPGE